MNPSRVRSIALLLAFVTCIRSSHASTQVVSWGYYWKSKSSVFVPVSPPPALNDAVAVAGGAGHSLALLGNGTVVAWGDNTFRQTSVPAGLSNVVAITAGDYHNLALRSDGTVVAWGDNTDGQTAVPQGLTNVVAISAAFFHSLALRADGTVVAWGGDYGRLLNIPPGLSNVVAIASRNVHSLALKADGTMVEWGIGGPEQVPSGLTNIVAVAVGETHSLALTADGRLIAWGGNSLGQATVPAGVTNVASFAAGAVHNVALLDDDSVLAWGAGTDLNPADGDFLQSRVPANLTNVAAVAAGYIHSIALLRGGPPVLFPPAVNRTVVQGSSAWLIVPVTAVPPILYQWSFNGTNLPAGTNAVLTLENVMFAQNGIYSLFVSNQFGVASSSNIMVTVVPLVITDQPRSQAALVGSIVTLTVGATGQRPFLYQWQFNGIDIPGATNDTFVIEDAKISDSGAYTVIVSNSAGPVRSTEAAVVITDNAVATWGNSFSLFTNGTLNVPNIVAVAGGYVHTLALQADGRVLAWGENYYGQTNVPSNLTNAVAIAAGLVHSVALRADGKVVAWGNNDFGQASVPADLDHVVAIAASSHNLALKANGTVVAWGNNSDAVLNYGGQTDVPSGLTNIVAVAAGKYYSMALKADGTVASWGAVNTTLIPPNLKNAVAISAGGFHSLALRADGTVAAWGQNVYGQATVPSNLTNVIAIAAGDYHSMALKSDGNLVVWGAGRLSGQPPNYGQSAVPPGVSNVTAIGAGSYQSMAIVGGGRPFLTSALVSRLAIYGQTINLRVAAQGAGPLSYQWIFNGTNLPGATNATLILSNVEFSDSGKYSVRVSNALGEVVSSDMVLSVAPFLITAQPQSQATFLGATVQLSVAVSGQGPIYYQWRLNGTNIPDATNSKLVLTNLRIEHSGLYSVLVSNPVGSAMSDTVFLSVGEVIAWGYNGFIATNLPFGLTNISAIAAGDYHSLALRADGTVIAWGERAGTNVPKGLTNVVAVAAGATHSVAIKSDTTVVAWGTNDLGQFRVPFGLSNVIAVAAGGGHSLALKADHTVQSWGYYYYGNPLVPNNLTNAIAIAAGDSHSVALKADGTVTVWGDDGWSESIVPSGLSNVIAIAAGGQHTAALKADGTVVVWGASYAGQTNIPLGLNNVIVISAGEQHTIAMKADKSLVTWGNDRLTTPPPEVRNVRAFSAGGYDLAMLGNAPLILDQPINLIITEGSNALFAVFATGVPSPSYQWRKDGVDISGATASVLSLNGIQPGAGGLYSVTVSNAYGVLTSSNALLTINHPPVADASATLLEVISSNKINAAVVLDGSRSSDPDGDPLQYLWFITGSPDPLATGVAAIVTLPVGTNSITLEVSDPYITTSQIIQIEVLTASQAVDRLVATVSSDVTRSQPLAATLMAAIASIDRSNPTAAINQLQAFQNQIQTQLQTLDPTLAQSFIQAAQTIIDDLSNDVGGQSIRVAFNGLARQSNGKMRMQFSGAPGKLYVIAASTNLLDWELIGVGSEQTSGSFGFEDENAARMDTRFYKITVP